MLRRLHPDQPDTFAFAPANQAWAEAQITKFPEGRQASAVIPLLWRAQEQEGWLSRPALEFVAKMLGMAYIRVLEVATDSEIKNIEKNFTFLATVGSTAPFIGLFGTVWGIMNSFQSIAISRNTSLAIVAPGIAEALFATALGLLAAIPAVVAYNKFNSDSKRYTSRIDNFSKRFLSII